jgi:uncharacterized phage infection (PIP) family protein YhgE
MGTRSEELRQEIAQTRAELGQDVDRLADRTSPRRIIRRRAYRVRDAARRFTNRVMGTPDTVYGATYDTRQSVRSGAESVRHGVSQAAESVREGAGQAADMVRSAPEQAMRQTQGNPLAAGLIAFGAGLLAAALIPTTEAEKRAAAQAGEYVEPVADSLKEAAQTLGQEAKQTAQEAAGHVRESASQAARTTGEQARSVKDEF